MNEQEHISPDGQLCLRVTVEPGDITIGFKHCPAHTHGSILAEFYGCSEEAASTRFVSGILEGKLVIAVRRKSGALIEAWVPETNWQTIADVVASEQLWSAEDEAFELRFWDGTKVGPPSIT